MRVIFASHTGALGGAERSLLDLIVALPDVAVVLATPDGPLAREAGRIGVPVARLPGTDVSLKLHPLRTPRGLAGLLRSSVELARSARRHRAQVIHANSVRSGLIAAGRPAGMATLVHVRDRLPPGRVSDASLRIAALRASAVVANSSYTAEPLRRLGIEPSVVPNPVDTREFDPARFDREQARSELGLEQSGPVLALTAQITPWKGQDDAIRIVHELRDEHPNVVLLLAGSPKFTAAATRHDNRAFESELHALAERLGVSRQVRFLGERVDVARVLAAADVALVPSWAEPFGRAVIEAMAMRVPVVATSVGGPAEILADEAGGRLCPPFRPQEWAAVVSALLGDSSLRRELGERGRQRVETSYTPAAHAAALTRIYATLPGPRRPSSSP